MAPRQTGATRAVFHRDVFFDGMQIFRQDLEAGLMSLPHEHPLAQKVGARVLGLMNPSDCPSRRAGEQREEAGSE